MPDFTRALCTLASALLVVGAQAQFGGNAPALVDIATVSSQSLAPTISVPGTVISRDQSRISSQVSGRLVSVAEVGDQFAAGETLASIDRAQLDLQRQEQKANLEQQSSRIGFLENELTRLRRLAAENNAAQSRLEEVQSDLAAARGALGAARARLKTTELLLSYSNLTAPFPGQVTARLARPGETVSPGTPIVELTNLERLEVSAFVPVRSVRYLDDGALVRLGNDFHDATGVVRTRVPAGEGRSHMYEVRIGVDGEQFRVNEDVRVAVPTADPELLLVVPRDALVLRRGATTVFRVSSELSAEAIGVTTGVASGDLIAISGGLAAGDRIVVRGAERLRDGQSVQIRNSVGSGESPVN